MIDCVIAQLAAGQAGTAALGCKQAGLSQGMNVRHVTVQGWHPRPFSPALLALTVSGTGPTTPGEVTKGISLNTLNFEPFSSWAVLSHEQCVACSGRRKLLNEGFSQNPTEGWVDFVVKMLNFHQFFETAPKPESGGSGCASSLALSSFYSTLLLSLEKILKIMGSNLSPALPSPSLNRVPKWP